MSEEIKERQAKCTYYGKTTHKVKRYNNCECNVCCKAIPENSNDGKCICIAKSDPKLPFFQAQPDKEYDEFFCGCQGWD